MWKIKLNNETIFENECQMKCISHLVIKDYYNEEGYKILMETDREKKEIRILKNHLNL